MSRGGPAAGSAPAPAPACAALIATVHQASADVTNFVRRCRAARTDLAPATRELSELLMVLQLLDDGDADGDNKNNNNTDDDDDDDLDDDDDGAVVPAELRAHLRPILAGCETVVRRISGVLGRHEQEEYHQYGYGLGGFGAHGPDQQQQHPLSQPPRWSTEGREEVVELAKSLGVHRGVVGLVSDLVAVLVSRGGDGVREQQPHAHRPRQQQQQQEQIVGVLEELRALGGSIRMSYSNAALAREHFALQVHLGQIIRYTETLAARGEAREDAVRTIHDARAMGAGVQVTSDPAGGVAVRGAVTAAAAAAAMPPRGRRSSRSDLEAAGYAEAPNAGLETLLPMGSPEHHHGAGRTPSTCFSPNRTPEPGGGTAPATGFIVMDGFINSGASNCGGSPTQFAAYSQGQGGGGPYERGGLGLGVSNTTSTCPPAKQPIACGKSATPASDLIPMASQAAEPHMLPTEAGLEVVIPPETEKELAMGTGRRRGEVTEEALAFAQVPVHVLGRLSVNLVDQLYTNNHSLSVPGSDKMSFDQSLSTIKTEEEDGEGDDVTSTGTSDTGSFRDGNLNFAHLDTSKLPPPPAARSAPAAPPPAAAASISQTSGSWSTTQTQHPAPRPPPSTESLALTNSSYPASQQREDSLARLNNHPYGPQTPDDAQSLASSHLKPDSRSATTISTTYGHRGGVRPMQSVSTMNTETFRMQKPLPKAPIVYIPGYPGPFIKKKAVVVGNFSCGKTCLITRMSRGHFPRGKNDKSGIMETVKLSIDEEPVELSLWDIRGIDYDPTWLNDAHVALVCFSVNIGSTDSKGKHLGRWVAEVNRNCPGAAILLVGLKADIRFHARSVEKLRRSGKALVTPEQGEQFRDNIGASRYLECSARTGEGVLEVLGETARVAMHIRSGDNWRSRGRRPLSRLGRFFGLSSSSSTSAGGRGKEGQGA